MATLDFYENEENGGDIWTDPQITAAHVKDEERVELEMEDFGEFRFFTSKGQYI